jgi:hypothetical protein
MFCVDPYRGYLKVKLREYKKEGVVRQFDKNESIFKDWRECNQKSLLKGFEYELKYWRVPKFVKDTDMQKSIYNILTLNRDMIKTLFITLCAQSNFPALSWLDFQNFLEKLEIVGVQGF